jgi:hypothetical protein
MTKPNRGANKSAKTAAPPRAAARTATARKPAAKPKPPARAANAKPAAPAKPKPQGKPAPVKPTVTAKPPVTTAKPAAKPAVNGSGHGKLNGHSAKPAVPPVLSKPAAKLPVPKPLIPAPFKPSARPEPVIAPEKDLSCKSKTGTVKDRIALMASDPYWLHVVWEISQQSVFRAEAALGPDWHGAKPILRLLDVTSTDTTSTSEGIVRNVPIHGGVSHWYLDVPQPPRSYRVDIGYLAKTGQFFVLARSNVVTPPKAGASESMPENWAADVEKAGGVERVLAMSTGFETTGGPSQLKDLLDEQFKRPMKEGAFGAGAAPGRLKKFHFDINAELIVFGQTDPNATVTLQNDPVKLRPDGTFTVRFSLPDSRQIIPAVAVSADGLEEQTIVLAVERNIKRLDPMTHDMYTEG